MVLWCFFCSKIRFVFLQLNKPCNFLICFLMNYRNYPKFSDRQAWANSADPDQTAPRGAVWLGSTLFAIPSASFGLNTLWLSHIVQILEWLPQIFWVSEYLGHLRYRDFSMKWWYHFCYFHPFKNGIFMNSGWKVMPKGLRWSILSKITARMLTFCDQTADITYCADVMFFLHLTSGRLSQTAAFSLHQFLMFHCFKCYLASFSRYKTAFLSNIMSPKHAEQDQIDAKCLGKKLVFWHESQREGRSLVIVNKSIKETENLIFFRVRSNFISLMNTRTCIFTRGYCHMWKYCFWYLLVK